MQFMRNVAPPLLCDSLGALTRNNSVVELPKYQSVLYEVGLNKCRARFVRANVYDCTRASSR